MLVGLISIVSPELGGVPGIGCPRNWVVSPELGGVPGIGVPGIGVPGIGVPGIAVSPELRRIPELLVSPQSYAAIIIVSIVLSFGLYPYRNSK